jgi:hypothetical protein
MKYLENPLDQERDGTFEAVSRASVQSAMGIMLSFRSHYQRTCLHPEIESRRNLLDLLKQILIYDDEALKLRATDGRDKIYSLLVLAVDNKQLNIRVNNAESYKPAALYKDVSRALLTYGNLDILGFRPRRTVSNNLPSWVCDWSSKTKVPFRHCIDIHKPFSASRASTFKISFAEDGQILEIGGLRVDEVSQTGCVTAPEAIKNGDWPIVHHFISDTQQLCHSLSDAGLARLLIGGPRSFRRRRREY